MRRKGYYRWLLTYLPIFFIIISALIVIFFFAMSNYSRKQTVLANEVFAEHVLQAIDSSLQYTEKMIIKELLTDEKLGLFYSTKQLTPFDYYEISQRMNDITVAVPPVKSIYLYRASDGLVLAPNRLVPLEQFGDRAFVEQSLRKSMPYAWSDSRDYREFEGTGSKMNVVSMFKRVPIGTGNQGLLVVNVLTSSLNEMYNNFSDMKDVFVSLSDGKQSLLFGEQLPANKQLSELKSAYSGWVIQSGLKNKQTYDVMSILSNVWSIAGLLTVLAGTVWMVYMIRRNYKPIESIKKRIQSFGNERIMDEFNFINSSIENLIETSNSYEKNYKENLIFRKRWFFDELIEGERPIELAEWQQEMKRLGLSDRFDRLAVAILEIDRYADFCEMYSHWGQQRLKFAVASVIKEMAQVHSIYTWNEWVSNYQVGILFTLTTDNDDNQVAVYQFCEAVRGWIEQNLKFTVTFGIGNIVNSILEASQSYHDGLEALQYKTNLGMNRTIGHWEIDWLPQGQIYRLLPDIRLMAQTYRLGEETWKQHLNQLFVSLRTAMSPRDEIISLMNYIIFTIQQEMSALPPEMNAIWEQHGLQQLNRLLNQFDVLEQVETRFFDILSEAADKIGALREKRDNHKLIRGVRQYIIDNFADPDLSLNQLSDAFQMNLKSLSRVFKEEFGENFVNYLTRIRIDNAKKLLIALPDEPIQDIARKSGYVHSISFIRVFKKLEGVTPGDYRKESMN